MGNKFENCDTCDYANDRYWFGGVACGDRFNLEDGECSGNGYPNWSLRRDKRGCDNCSHPNKYRTEEFHCYRSYEYGCVNWISKPITEEKPETYKCIMHKGYLCPVLNPNYNKQMCDLCDDYFKEEKQTKNLCDTCNRTKCMMRDGIITTICANYMEEPMSYKPTSKCTLKNIASKINETGCSEAKAEFFDVVYKTRIKDGYAPVPTSNIGSEEFIFDELIKTEKRRNWLSKHGFIEEEIKYKSYTIDYMSYNLNIKTKVEFNGYIDDEDEDTLFFKLDNGKAFNIDKDLITNIKPKTPF